jgi:hypothetical protein
MKKFIVKKRVWALLDEVLKHHQDFTLWETQMILHYGCLYRNYADVWLESSDITHLCEFLRLCSKYIAVKDVKYYICSKEFIPF